MMAVVSSAVFRPADELCLLDVYHHKRSCVGTAMRGRTYYSCGRGSNTHSTDKLSKRHKHRDREAPKGLDAIMVLEELMHQPWRHP
jgi:hypothetical protein